MSRWGFLRGRLDCARLPPVRNLWKNKTRYKKKYFFIKKKKRLPLSWIFLVSLLLFVQSVRFPRSLNSIGRKDHGARRLRYIFTENQKIFCVSSILVERGVEKQFCERGKTNSHRIHFDTAFQETCRFFVVMESRIAGFGPGPCPAVSQRNVAEIRIFKFPRGNH